MPGFSYLAYAGSSQPEVGVPLIWKEILACTASIRTDGSVCFVVHKWQDLISGVIGASALVATVAITLGAERRRENAAIRAFKIAIGTEIRQLSRAAADCFKGIDGLLPQGPGVPRNTYLGSLVAFSQLPAPVVYPAGTDKVGMLGPVTAERIVYFYGQLALIADSVARSPLIGREAYGIREEWQVRGVMEGFLNSMLAAVRLRELIRSPEWFSHDAEFKRTVDQAVAKFKVLFEQPGGAAMSGPPKVAPRPPGP